MAAPFAIETPCSDFVGKKYIKKRILFGCIGKVPSDAETETRLVATEVVDCDDEVSIGTWDCSELIEFRIPPPVRV